MNKKILIAITLIAVVMMTIPVVAPVMAKRPKLPYSMGIITVEQVEPSTEWVSGEKIVHGRGGITEYAMFAVPWGDGTSLTSGIMNYNMETLNGGGLGKTVDTYADGTIEGTINWRWTGAGLFVYGGPTFTIDGVTVEAGDMFGGLQLSGIAVKHGTSGVLEGLQMRGTFVGVVIMNGPLALVGKMLSWETGTYW